MDSGYMVLDGLDTWYSISDGFRPPHPLLTPLPPQNEPLKSPPRLGLNRNGCEKIPKSYRCFFFWKKAKPLIKATVI